MTCLPLCEPTVPTDLPPSVELLDGPCGLPLLKVSAPGGSGEIFLNGAHLASWIPEGHADVLWMSSLSRYGHGLPIRGGVPICFPWFGYSDENPGEAQHGFARTQPWKLLTAHESDQSVVVIFRLTDSEESRKSTWPYRFEATYSVTIGSELKLVLEIVNLDDVAFSFEESFHTYYAIGDIQATRITGSRNLELPPETLKESSERHPAESEILRNYTQVTQAAIEDLDCDRTIIVATEGSQSALVWNPGRDRAETLEDFASDGWVKMICFETGNTGGESILLGPGGRHQMIVNVSVSPRK